MTPFNSILFIIFGIILYMMIVDENVSTYLTLVFKLTRSNIQRLLWMAKYHPNNFVTTWIRNREYDRIARELEKEFNMSTEE